MALLTPPPAAPQRGDRTTFASRVDAFITWLINFVTEMLALVANLNTIAAGGAFTLPFTFATTGGTGTTTGGKIACANIASQSTTTYFAIDLTDAKGSSIAAQLAQAVTSTSAVKGAARLVKMGDASKYIILNITGWSPSTYSGLLSGAVIDSSSTNPFANGDDVMLYLQRAGDKGDTGATGSVLTGVLHVADIRSSGTTGQGAAAGTTTRTLNTVVRNTISGASLASNQVTLPAGTYRVNGSVPAYGVGQHQAYLYNTTTSSNILAGTSEADNGSNSRSELLREIVLAAQSVIEVRHWLGSSSGSLGNPTGSGVGEVYTQLIFEKVA
jgi:hypothetical protein